MLYYHYKVKEAAIMYIYRIYFTCDNVKMHRAVETGTCAQEAMTKLRHRIPAVAKIYCYEEFEKNSWQRPGGVLYYNQKEGDTP